MCVRVRRVRGCACKQQKLFTATQDWRQHSTALDGQRLSASIEDAQKCPREKKQASAAVTANTLTAESLARFSGNVLIQKDATAPMFLVGVAVTRGREGYEALSRTLPSLWHTASCRNTRTPFLWLITELCPAGQRHRLTLNKSTLLV